LVCTPLAVLAARLALLLWAVTVAIALATAARVVAAARLCRATKLDQVAHPAPAAFWLRLGKK
jgi:hypothetical protein